MCYNDCVDQFLYYVEEDTEDDAAIVSRRPPDNTVPMETIVRGRIKAYEAEQHKLSLDAMVR